jgi:hypothetical protein
MSASDVQPQSPSAVDYDVISEHTGVSPSPHGKHEAYGEHQTDPNEALSPTQEEPPADQSNGVPPNPESDTPLEDTANTSENAPQPDAAEGAAATAKAEPAKAPVKKTTTAPSSTTAKAKAGMASTADAKTAGTSSVKKVNSSTWLRRLGDVTD